MDRWRRQAALNPIRGRDKVARFFAGIVRDPDKLVHLAAALGRAQPRGRGARLPMIRCSVRRCMPSRRAVSLTLRSHCS